MEYFDRYLKELNKDGDTFKRRVITAKEKRFDKFVKRSIYRSDNILTESGENITGSIQPTKDTEKTCIYNLLTYKSNELSTGELIKDDGNTWLITHKCLDKTKGYNLYTLMLLPSILNYKDNDKEYTFPVRLTYDANEAIEDFFSSLTASARQYREPDRVLKAITKRSDKFEKDMKFLIEGDSFKIAGINKTAVPGCVYLTLNQCLTDMAQFDAREDNTNDSFWGVD